MTLARAAVVLGLAWIAAMAVLCLQSWPTIPLDLDARDPALLAAYRRAGLVHSVRYAAAALVPAALLLVAARILDRRRGAPSGD
ncbi:MAG: hypothetical protein AB1749_06765 [Pseudomonadota bacterium]